MKPDVDVEFLILVVILFVFFGVLFWGASEMILILLALIGAFLQ